MRRRCEPFNFIKILSYSKCFPLNVTECDGKTITGYLCHKLLTFFNFFKQRKQVMWIEQLKIIVICQLDHMSATRKTIFEFILIF